MSEPLASEMGLRVVEGAGGRPDAEPLLVRELRRDGRPLITLRLMRGDTHCLVEMQVIPRGGESEVRPGPYRFSTVAEATAFVDEAVEALTYLGCE